MTILSHEGSDGLFANTASDTLKHRSVRGGVVTMAAQMVRFVIQFLSQIVMVRLLDPTDFGLLAMVAPVMALVQLFNDLGLADATVQKPEIDRRDVSSLFWINVAASAGLCLLVILVSPLVGLFYHEPRTVEITIALSFVLIFGGLSSQQTALLRRAMRFRQQAIIDIAAMVAATIAGIAAALAHFGYWSLVVMPFAMMITTAILAWLFTRWLPHRPARNPNVGAMMRFGGHLTGANFLNFFARNLDNVLIGKVYGSDILGLYDRAYKLMLLPLGQIMVPVARVAVPLLSRLQGEPARYRNAFMQMMQTIYLAVMPGMVCAVALPNQVILTLFGEKWAGVGPIFFWLAIASLPSFMGHGSGWLFTSQGRVATRFKWECLSATLFVTSFLVGLPYGAVGVARAYAVTAVCLQGPLLWWVVTRHGPVTLRDIVRIIHPFVFAGACVFLALAAVKTHYGLDGLAGLAAGVAISYAVAPIALLLLPEGRNVLRNALAIKSVLRRPA